MRGPQEGVLFLDASGQGFTRNLAALRDQLLLERADIPLRYSFSDLASDTISKSERGAVRRQIRGLASRSGAVVTASESKHARQSRLASGRKCVLILSPRLAHVDGTTPADKPVRGYTDVVVAGRAFVATARRCFPGSRVHPLGLPVFTELVSDDMRARARSHLATICPGVADRRIVVITTQRKPEQVFGLVSPVEFVQRLPEDVFVILDVPDALTTLEAAPAALAERLFVNDGTFGLFLLIALADEFLTSKFRDAVFFSVTGRRLRFLNTAKNVGTLGEKLPNDYAGLGIADIVDLPEALARSYDERARLQFQAEYAVEDPARSASLVVQALF